MPALAIKQVVQGMNPDENPSKFQRRVLMVQLYHKVHCPYSAKVRDCIEERGLRSQIDYLDVEEDPEAHSHLQKMTGRNQVPCLVIDGEPLLESDDIIQWIEKNLQ